MQKPDETRLIAYLDGELDEKVQAEVAAWLDHDPALREKAASLAESAVHLRAAFDEVLREPLPSRLVAAARGVTVVSDSKRARFQRAQSGIWRRRLSDRRWLGVSAAASIACLALGTGLGYFAANAPVFSDNQPTASTNLASTSWLDNIAGYHKLFVAAGPDDTALADVPANEAGGDNTRKVVQKLPPDFRLPNLKPWGLVFQGARFLIIEGRPATQLFYTTDNQALGPLTVVVGTSTKPDLAPTFDHRDDVNLLYWRHHGHAYALVGTADIGYLWNIANDIAWQLDAI